MKVVESDESEDPVFAMIFYEMNVGITLVPYFRDTAEPEK